MGRASTKENKNRYQLSKEELALTREEASDLLQVLSSDRIEKIENERMDPQPYDVLATGFWAARISKITEDDTVLLIGAGPMPSSPWWPSMTRPSSFPCRKCTAKT